MQGMNILNVQTIAGLDHPYMRLIAGCSLVNEVAEMLMHCL